MPQCSFCKKNMTEHEGLLYAKNDGRIFYYCSSKCEKNTKMGRLPRNTKWVKE